jgi:indolepyruvate ferredoxin oxidoreductase
MYPASVNEVLSFGLHALACSRASGTWVAMKLTTDVADGIATLRAPAFDPVLPDESGHEPNGRVLAPDSLEMERSLFERRLPIAARYAALNAINEIVGADHAWLGIVAAGKTWTDLLQALSDFGIGEDELDHLGVRLLKVGMLYPLEREVVQRFARGLAEILVIEEKQPLLEPAIRQLLYGSRRQPRLLGKADLPVHGALDQDALAPLLARTLAPRAGTERFRPRLEQIRAATSPERVDGAPVRSAIFCSGCPHNRSTTAPDGALVGAGIGCHSLVLLSPERRGELTAMTQMGGEGAQWIGISPFIDPAHVFQNIGDGTFHHSGSLAIRAAVAAGVDVTFKLLYNGAVAMTGGQAIEGGRDVPSLTRLLEAEGVSRTIVTTDAPERYRRLRLASNASIRHRDELERVSEELARVPGVTVLVHDQQCAIEKRRAWRHTPHRRKTRVVIDERVCEGCGDCVRASSCVSLVPVDTSFGRKMQVHDPSCNEDLSCLQGDCPSFLTVEVDSRARPLPAAPPRLPEPHAQEVDAPFVIRMVGIGGTGTTSLNRIVGAAAAHAGLAVVGLDQTGLSQKGGTVVSDVILQRVVRPTAGRASAASVDLYLGLDIVGAADGRYLRGASAARTSAVVSTTVTPTAAHVADPVAPLPDVEKLRRRIDGFTRSGSQVYLDAGRLSERLFGDHLPAGLIVLGAAWQAGLLPLPLASLEYAIGRAGLDRELGLLAFAWGRTAVAEPKALAVEQAAETPALTAAQRQMIESAGLQDEARGIAERFVPELVAYQSLDYARTYLDFLTEVSQWEATGLGGRGDLTATAARQLFKLMAYKDEYEVARLHLLGWQRRRQDGKVRWHLHPPLLRTLGLKRKIRVGRWILPLFRLLVAVRWLRGRRLDVFGWPHLRRVERKLPNEYKELLRTAVAQPGAPSRPDILRDLCESPETIRGYEHIKLDAIDRWRADTAELVSALSSEQVPAAA